ncbi:lipase [Nemania abortiva]|nr:lipase [Nemania abortiva]
MKLSGWSLILGFALAAAGSPLAAPEMMLNGRAAISTEMLATLKLYSQYAGASYCNSEKVVGSTVTCIQNACPDVTAAGAKITATYKGSRTDIRGFVSTDAKNKVIVVSIRGSHSVRNWITDLRFLQKDCTLVSGCKVHTGFATAWDEISATVLSAVKAARAANPTYKIVFTGHSLGAAVSSLGAAYARKEGLPVDIINYGSPRVGNEAFATFVSNQAGDEWRVTHLNDPVPRLPPAWLPLYSLKYAHTTPEYWLSNGSPMKIDYNVSDITVCTGVKSFDCSARLTNIANVQSHLYYLNNITACSPTEFVLREAAVDDYLWWEGTSPPKNLTDAELAQQLLDWARQDVEMAAARINGSSF